MLSTDVSEATRTSNDAMVNATPGDVSLRRALACVPSPTRGLGGRPPTRSGGTISRSSSAGILLPPPRPVVRSTAAIAEAGNGSKEVGTTQQATGTVYSRNKAGSWCAGPPSHKDQGAPRRSRPKETAELFTNDAWRGSAGAPPPPSVSPRSPRPTRHLSVVDGGPCRSPTTASKGAALEASASIVDVIRQRVNSEGVQLLPFTAAALLECAGVPEESSQALSRQSSSAAIAVEGPVLPLSQPVAGDSQRRERQAIATRGPLPRPPPRIDTCCAEAASKHCAIVSSRLVNMLGRQSEQAPGHQAAPPSLATLELPQQQQLGTSVTDASSVQDASEVQHRPEPPQDRQETTMDTTAVTATAARRAVPPIVEGPLESAALQALALEKSAKGAADSTEQTEVPSAPCAPSKIASANAAVTELDPAANALTGLRMRDRIPRLEKLIGSPPRCPETDESEVAVAASSYVASETGFSQKDRGHSPKGKGGSKGKTSALPGHMETQQSHSVPPLPLPPPLGSKGKGKGKGPPPRLSLPSGATPRSASTPAPTPRKPEVKPKTPMKRLFWSSFVLGDDVLAEKDATVWSSINSDCPDTFDQDELERMFGDAASRPGLSARRESFKASNGPSAALQVAQRIRCFEESRRRQICVMLARLPPMSATVGAVQAMDTTVLGKDQVELLLANAPSAEELSSLQGVARAAGKCEESRWDGAEAFVLQLAGVPSFGLRLQVWAFENAFDERFALLQAVASEVFAACLALQKSPGIQRLLSLALKIGNYLNAGTPRGRADGFAIEGLAQMSTVKAMQAEAGGTLVDYLVRQLERARPGELQGLFGEGGEASIVRKAARHKLPDSLSELDSCSSQAQSLARQAADARDEVLGSWGQRLGTRLQELDDLRKVFDDAQAEYGRLCQWFHEGTSQKPRPSNEFLAVWDGFLQAVGVSLEALGASSRRKKAQHAQPHRSMDDLKRSFPSCGDQSTSSNGSAR